MRQLTLDDLVARAQTARTLVEIAQVDHALCKLPVEARRALTGTRVALLSSSTVDHLIPPIRVAGLRRGLGIDVYKGGFGQYRQELLERGSPLYGFNPEMIVLAPSASDLVGQVPLTAAREDVDRMIGDAVRDVAALWRVARERSGATVVQQSVLDVSEPLFGSFDRLVSAAPSRITARLNDALAEAAAAAGVLWLDIAREAARDGLDVWFDVRQWLHAKIEIAMTAGPTYGELVVRILAARRGLSKKCLVLDLDNTLWGGVLGDDGPEGIVLGQGTAAGEAHRALQMYAKRMKERGIILAVCSKNEPALVDAVFRDHPEMVLRRADIAAFAVNWKDKAENLQALAEELNIGLDSLVFVDDNPAERARVRESLPMVAVPELGEDPAEFVRIVARGGYFDAVSFTAEDRDRAAAYAANAERTRLERTSSSVEEFLRGLDMTVTFGRIAPVDLARSAQLINKTNQFNTTGRRYSVEELRAFCEAPGHIALQFRLVDRFGDNGIVSVMLLRPGSDDPAGLDVDCWVMSCRVFGRQLEQEAMNIAVEIARRGNAAVLTADFVPTARNGVIGRLYADLGFEPLGEAEPGMPRRWVIQLNGYDARPTFITRQVGS